MPEDHLRHYYKTSQFYLEGLLRKESDYHDTYVRLVRQFVRPGGLILDLGAGTGASSHALSIDLKTIALDLSHLFLKAGSERRSPKLFRVVGDSVVLPFKAGVLKLVGAFEMIEHVRDVESMFQEIDRVLVPGGVVLIISPNMLSPLNAALTLVHELRMGVLHRSRLAQVYESWYRTTQKLLGYSTSFLKQEVPDRQDLHSDMDACYLASPVDLKRWFTQRGYRVKRYQRGGRTRLGRFVNWCFGSYAPTIYFVAQKRSAGTPEPARAESP